MGRSSSGFHALVSFAVSNIEFSGSVIREDLVY
jgi:hypothetical protein